MVYFRELEADAVMRDWACRRAGHLVGRLVADGELDLLLLGMRWAFVELPFFVAFAGMHTLANAWCTRRSMTAEPRVVCGVVRQSAATISDTSWRALCLSGFLGQAAAGPIPGLAQATCALS